MSKLTILRSQDANSLKEIQFPWYYNFWTVIEHNPIYFILHVASRLCRLEGGMSHCLCSICNNIELWEQDKPHHLSAQISNWLAEIKENKGTWWACLCKSNPERRHLTWAPHTLKYLLYGWIYQVTMKDQDKGWQAH